MPSIQFEEFNEQDAQINIRSSAVYSGMELKTTKDNFCLL